MTTPNLPEPDALTDAMRRAVYLDDCEKKGHEFNYKYMVRVGDTPNPLNPGGMPNLEVESGEDGRLPYIWCPRCDSVWIVIDEPGFGYDDALRKVRKRMGSPADRAALLPKPRQERRRHERNMLVDAKRKNRRELKIEMDRDGMMTTETRTDGETPKA